MELVESQRGQNKTSRSLTGIDAGPPLPPTPRPIHQQTQHNLGEGREDIMVPCDKYTQYENSTMKKAIMTTG